MTRPATVVVREGDDERTLVDLRPDAKLPFEGSGQAESSIDFDEATTEAMPRWQGLSDRLLARKRKIFEGCVSLTLTLSLGGVAYQQWRAADALRDIIGRIETGRSTLDIQGPPGPSSGRFTLADTQRRSAGSIHEVAPDEREALERRGASLIGSNDFSGALTHYEMLAALFPDEAAFRDVVSVLKAKLRCAGSAEPTSGACP